jgi:uncharacterized protein
VSERVGSVRLNDRMREFIGRQEMVFVSSSGGEVLMRSGPAGFARVVGDRRVLVPELRGPVSLLFVDFFDDVGSLHVRGRASVPGRVVVEDAYFD